MKIYTKTGDRGNTSTLSGKRVAKSDALVEAIGSVDELNTALGVLSSLLASTQPALQVVVSQRQGEMLILGTMLGVSGQSELAQNYPSLTEADIATLEKDIDTWQQELPELTNFIIPGGTQAAAWAHHTRSICRRTERQIVLAGLIEEINPLVIKYSNRLSDWLFILARKLNDGKELKWSKGKILS
jgi:cob(I)alamin adenosyltransferase